MEDVLIEAIVLQVAEFSLRVPVPVRCEWKFCVHRGSDAVLSGDSG